MNYVIIGNGAAGIHAAFSIRKRDLSSKITIISKEKYLFYYRPGLINVISDKIPFEKTIIYNQDYYRKNDISCILNSRVEHIESDKKSVNLSDGKKINYDKLLIATGANCFVPPFSGIEKKGVYTVRNYDDVIKIKEFFQNKRIVFIGGGLLGLETACALIDKNTNGTVVEFFPSLLPRQLNPNGGNFLRKLLEKKFSLDFSLNSVTEEIIGNDSVSGIKLKSGRTIEAEGVIISAGVRPEISLAVKSGIKTNKGIIVNSNMETNLNDIYAAGDCCEYDGRVFGMWIPSKKQGELAGINMSGGNAKFTCPIFPVKIKVSGIDLVSLGEINFDNKECIEKQTQDYYIKIFKKNNKICGAVSIGNKEVVDLTEKIFNGKANENVIEKI